MQPQRGTLDDALAHLERGDWQKAHEIVQQLNTPEARWLHGIVHLLEGDLDNARYWYERAGREFSSDAQAQIAAARERLSGTPRTPGS